MNIIYSRKEKLHIVPHQAK